jgi:hypothetical protein
MLFSFWSGVGAADWLELMFRFGTDANVSLGRMHIALRSILDTRDNR